MLVRRRPCKAREEMCKYLNKHHPSHAQESAIVTVTIQGDSYFCCLNSWPVIKAWSSEQSHILCFLYILRIETCSMMWNTGLYSSGNWTCMITAMLLSAVHTNLQSMKSDLIKIVWSKFVLRFKSVNLSLCVYGVWYDACAIDEKYADSEAPSRRCKNRVPWLAGLRFRRSEHVFQCGRDDGWRGVSTVNALKKEIHQEERRDKRNLICARSRTLWKFVRTPVWTTKALLTTKEVWTQFPEQWKDLTRCMWGGDKKPLLLFDRFGGNLNTSLISTTSHQTRRVTSTMWSLGSIYTTKCASVSHIWAVLTSYESLAFIVKLGFVLRCRFNSDFCKFPTYFEEIAPPDVTLSLTPDTIAHSSGALSCFPFLNWECTTSGLFSMK